MGARLMIGLVRALHVLPLALLAPLGWALGLFAYAVARERRAVARINLALCFPELGPAAREAMVRAHFAAFMRGLLERGIAWWSSAERIRQVVRLEGAEHLAAAGSRPVILYTPHFVGCDMAFARIVMEHDSVLLHSQQKHAVVEHAIARGRTRFGRTVLVTRQEGVRRAIRLFREGRVFVYSPDLDMGPRDAVFVPFFGVPAATVTGLSRIAGLANALVIPCIAQQLPGGRGYVARLYPAWENYPGPSIEDDCRRMTAFLEARIREMPEQYHWLHKRFKTRPEGEPSPYGRYHA